MAHPSPGQPSSPDPPGGLAAVLRELMALIARMPDVSAAAMANAFGRFRQDQMTPPQPGPGPATARESGMFAAVMNE